MTLNVNDLDVNWQIAICLAHDMSQTEAAERLGCSRQTIYNRTRDDATFFDIAIAFIQGIKAIRFEQKVQEVVGPAEMRIKSMFDRSFRLSEKLLAKAEADDDPSYENLFKIHQNFTVWAAEYSTSKAPKRLKLEGGTHSTVSLIMPLEDARNLIETRSMLAKNVTPPALPPAEVATDA